ncbi:hypothetical protein DTO271D3_4019 [Paecilomyces variotii]|nr:hypothetical protein DTO169E5_1689 [Paecilomyces variotii]KAJ9268831.1 hypothetical protein DTO212C5_5032 [Paecilomyces variotii]KAJ9315763.1 hypothetical protein DTO271D3_4019 [Paecilomyces variotii]
MGGKDEAIPVFGSDVLLPALKAGGLSGSAGLLYGGISGILTSSPHQVVHSVSHGIHWFALGSSFWWLRSNILKLHFQNDASPKERAYTSAISGGVAGGAVTRLMGGRLVPGVVIFSMLGYLGQSSYNAIDRWQAQRAQEGPSKPFLQRLADSKWVPLKALSDEDYKHMLSEKLLNIEAEIALIDDKIQDLEKLKASSSEVKVPESRAK